MERIGAQRVAEGRFLRPTRQIGVSERFRGSALPKEESAFETNHPLAKSRPKKTALPVEYEEGRRVQMRVRTHFLGGRERFRGCLPDVYHLLDRRSRPSFPPFSPRLWPSLN